ncbi:branched-chain amino acid ABC transporter permease [Streptosporangium roseum]|uniref:branched-chain amino acid ABC transporter permease n=1 Tax=Streptosporangium roseum TaxID=2001 RepID=UPI0004CD06FF|nr:branched-chain amino acid ABC transporter permease [Streptosporangium roseum]
MTAQVWIDGVFAGAVYALVALGLAITFQPTRVMNFAQGEALILGAAIGYQMMSLGGLGWPVALTVTVVGAGLMGLLAERMIMLPVRMSGSRFAWIVATLAVALIFQSLFTLAYRDVDALRPEPLATGGFALGDGRVGWQELITVGIALAVMAAYDLFLRRGVYGRAIRAASHDPDTAVLMGIPVQRMVVLSFVIATVITALAGLLAAPVLYIGPATGLLFTIKGFTAAVIGGIGSPRGALAGGLIVGVLDSVVRTAISAAAGNLVVFSLLVLILMVFPAGLFGKPMEAH